MIYDAESNIISWEVAKGSISHAREVGNLIIHMGSGGKPVLIEMLEADNFIKQFDSIKNIKDIKKILPIN